MSGISVGSIVLALGAIELIGSWLITPLIVRYSENQALKFQLANPETLGVASLYVPHHYYLYAPRPGYRSADAKIRHNSMGCRAEEVSVPKPAGVYRIVTVGGSTTYSTLVRANEEIYTYKLEKLLNDWSARAGFGRSFEVLNCGVPGYTSAENLARYIFVLSEYKADLLVIQQGINDALARALPRLSRDYHEFSKTWEEVDVGRDQWFLKRLARAAIKRFSGSIWTQGINYMVRHPFWDKKASGSDPVHYDKNSPWIFESNTRYLVRLASGDGANVLLLTEHIVVDKADDWRAMSNSRAKATLEHNSVVENVAQGEGAFFFDLQKKLCACEAIMPDSRHLNEEGETQKAQRIFEYLTGKLLLRRQLAPRHAVE